MVVLLPLLLLILGALASAIVAYGTHPAWGQYTAGYSFIIWSRQFQWPIAALAIVSCVALIGLVVAGKRRAWWLIGLGPILALFVHRLHSDPLRAFGILDNPACVPTDRATVLEDDDYVVGVVINDSAYAYPYFALYENPVVVQADHDKRMILMWSAFANRALAYSVSRDLHARDLEIVSMPRNALLLYNTKLGEFINGVTGRTPKDQKPAGFGLPLIVEKTTWRRWRAAHPSGQALGVVAAPTDRKIVGAPLRPAFAMPALQGSLPGETRIVLVATTQPISLPAEEVQEKPLNLAAGQTAALVFRDGQSGKVRAFDRTCIGVDAPLNFKLNSDRERKLAILVDTDTNSGWSAEGRAVDGRLASEGRRMAVIPVDDGLYWGVMKTWMPELLWVNPAELK